MSWHPERYLAFDDHRTRPAADLLARVPLGAPERVVDLGCGPGNSTALLAERWPEAAVTGVDSAPAMLDKARASGIGAAWHEADIADWEPAAPVDLLFSNAALQWLPDHEVLLPRLLGQVRPGGVLAIQMPRNFQAEFARHPARARGGGAMDRPASGRLAGRSRRVACLVPRPAGAARQRSTSGRPSICRCCKARTRCCAGPKSTALRPVIDTLDDEDEIATFKAAYAARLREAYPGPAGRRHPVPVPAAVHRRASGFVAGELTRW